MAAADGLDIQSVEHLPSTPPTVDQTQEALQLGIEIPSEISSDDLRALVNRVLYWDKPARRDHKEFAEETGVFFVDEVGKKQIFRLIFRELTSPGKEFELCSWFAYRVYRDMMKGSPVAEVTSPFDPRIKQVADELVVQKRVVDSIRRYSGEDLIWFGTWASPDGHMHTGGSNRTIAFQETTDLMREIVSAENRVVSKSMPANQPLAPAKLENTAINTISRRVKKIRTTTDTVLRYAIPALVVICLINIAVDLIWK
jgi:hypothetical protein